MITPLSYYIITSGKSDYNHYGMAADANKFHQEFYISIMEIIYKQHGTLFLKVLFFVSYF